MTTAIGLARLSVDTDESTSIARQRQAITDYCKAQGWDLLGIAEDVDVSGKTPVLDRPEAGNLLRAGGFQRVVFLKLDRCSRSVVEFRQFASWCEDHGAAVVSIQESLDLATPAGKFVATIIAAFAEMERETIAARVRDSKRHLGQIGRWAGGSVPYGHRAVQNGNGWKLEADPETAEVVRDWARRAIAGESVASIAKSAGRHGQSLSIILRALALGGHDKRVEGSPVLDLEVFEDLQAALDGKRRPHSKRHDASPLLGTVYCRCGRQLYVQVQERKSGKRYEYAKCSGRCGAKPITLEHVLAAVERKLSFYDVLPHGTWKLPAKTDRDREVSAIKAAIRALDLDDPDYDAKHDKLRGDLRTAQMTPAAAPEPVWVPDGLLVGDVRGNDAEATRRFMLDHGMTARIWRNSDRLTVRIDGRDFVAEGRALGAKILGASDFDGTNEPEDD